MRDNRKRTTPTAKRIDANANVTEVPAGASVEQYADVGRVFINGEARYIVQTIVDYFVNKRRLDWYKVKWFGWDSYFNSWERSAHIEEICLDLTEKYFEQHARERVRKKNVIKFEEFTRRKSAKRNKRGRPKKRVDPVLRKMPRVEQKTPSSRTRPSRQNRILSSDGKFFYDDINDSARARVTPSTSCQISPQPHNSLEPQNSPSSADSDSIADFDFDYIPSFDGSSVGIRFQNGEGNPGDLIIDDILIDETNGDFHDWLGNGSMDDMEAYICGKN